MVSAALIGLPVLPPVAASTLRPIDQEVIETYGWPQFTAQVVAATRGLPAGTVVFTSNYGEAGAFSRFGHGLGLHLPVASAHNGYAYWGPPKASDRLVVAVGEWKASDLQPYWADVTEIAPLHLAGITDQETANQAAILRVPGAARDVRPAMAPSAAPRLGRSVVGSPTLDPVPGRNPLSPPWEREARV